MNSVQGEDEVVPPVVVLMHVVRLQHLDEEKTLLVLQQSVELASVHVAILPPGMVQVGDAPRPETRKSLSVLRSNGCYSIPHYRRRCYSSKRVLIVLSFRVPNIMDLYFHA